MSRKLDRQNFSDMSRIKNVKRSMLRSLFQYYSKSSISTPLKGWNYPVILFHHISVNPLRNKDALSECFSTIPVLTGASRYSWVSKCRKVFSNKSSTQKKNVSSSSKARSHERVEVSSYCILFYIMFIDIFIELFFFILYLLAVWRK